MKHNILLLAAFALSFLISVNSIAQDSFPSLRPLRDKALSGPLYPAEKKGKWGFKDEKGHFVIKANFDYAFDFVETQTNDKDTLVAAKVNWFGKVGMIRRDGTYLLEPVYDEIRGFGRNGIAFFVKDGKTGFANIKGEILASGYDSISSFISNGLTEFAWCKSSGKWGAISFRGSVLVPPKFDAVPLRQDEFFFLTEIEGKYGMLNATGSISEPIPAEYDKIEVFFGDCLICSRNGKFGCFNKNGTQILPCIFGEMSYNQNYRAIIAGLDGKFGVYSSSGKEIIHPVLDRKPEISGSDSYTRINENGNLMLLGKDLSYVSVNGYEKKLKSRGGYASDSNLPAYFKPSLYEAEGYQALRWYDDHPTPSSNAGNKYPVKLLINSGDEDNTVFAVLVDRNRMVLDYAGNYRGEEYGLSMSAFTPDQGRTIIKTGNLFTSLFSSVNQSKVVAYDKKNGTNILRGWSSMSFYVNNCERLSDGTFLLLVDMYIDSEYVQRCYAIVDAKGKVYNKWLSDGYMYNQSRFVTDSKVWESPDCFIVTERYNKSGNFEFSTQVRKRSGELVHTYNNSPLPENIIITSGYIVMSGYDNRQDGSQLVIDKSNWSGSTYGYDWNSDYPPYEWADNVLASRSEDCDAEQLMFPDAGLKSVPVLKFWRDYWADAPILAVATQQLPPQGERKWSVVNPLDTEASVNLPFGCTFKVLGTDAGGNTVYALDNGESYTRYGIIGPGVNTQAVYSEVPDFVAVNSDSATLTGYPSTAEVKQAPADFVSGGNDGTTENTRKRQAKFHVIAE